MGLSAHVFRIFSLAAIAFIVAFLWTPLLTRFLYRYHLGKRIRDAGEAPIMAGLHAAKAGTPTMGGVLIWGTTLVLTLVFSFFPDFSFLSRRETLLPLGALVAAALVGLVDDLFNVWKLGAHGGGLRMRHRLLIYTSIAAIGAWWFYVKLSWDALHIPFYGDVTVGLWYIPIFVFVIVATAFSVNEIDGLDGLAGGTLLTAFGAYGAIAFIQGRYDLASLISVIVGALLAFLWFNITPARFFMGDTGAMSLGVTLGVIAMLTNAALFLPVIGLLFVVEALSVIVQIFSKRIFHRKIFRSAPIHHHFEAIGWPEAKVVMRFWVIAGVTAVFGLILFLLDRGLT